MMNHLRLLSFQKGPCLAGKVFQLATNTPRKWDWFVPLLISVKPHTDAVSLETPTAHAPPSLDRSSHHPSLAVPTPFSLPDGCHSRLSWYSAGRLWSILLHSQIHFLSGNSPTRSPLPCTTIQRAKGHSDIRPFDLVYPTSNKGQSIPQPRTTKGTCAKYVQGATVARTRRGR